MKRYILIVAAVALATVSCSRNYDVQPAGEGAEIGFGTWAENLTKAEARVQGTNDFLAGDTFAVYGYKAKSDDSGKVTAFDDDVVTASGSGTLTWDYPNHRFWDVNFDKYVFFGISPSAIGTAAEVNAQTGAITSQTITFAGNNNDILVAEKTTVEKGSAPYFNNYGTVDMVFNHVASLVDFKVAKAAALHDAVVNVTGFTLGNIQNQGILSVDGTYNATVYGGTTGPVVTWSNSGKGSYVPTSGVVPVYGADNINGIASDNPKLIAEDNVFPVPAEPAEGKSTTIINHLVVKPQAFVEPTNRTNVEDAGNADAQKITISYTITTVAAGGASNTNEYTATIWLYDFDLVNDKTQDASTFLGGWLTGKHYTFYITLDANPIVFGAKVNDWGASVGGYHYLLN